MKFVEILKKIFVSHIGLKVLAVVFAVICMIVFNAA